MGSLGGAVWRWRGGCGGGGGGAGLAAFVLRAVLRRAGGGCPCCAGRRRGFVQFLEKVVPCPLLRRQVHEGVAGAVLAVVDVLIPCSDVGFAHSEGASDSVHRAV